MGRVDIVPQPGPQTRFFECGADIVFYGGAAGGGKSWSLYAEPLRWVGVPGYTCIIFRRTYPEITKAGALWDMASELYAPAGGKSNRSELTWRWPGRVAIGFSHLQHEKDRHTHQGAQYAAIKFDELTHFTERQFWYLISRNRSTCGVRPYCHASMNPDPDSWVRKMVDWYLTPKGDADPAKAGVVRWFVRDPSGELAWYATEAEARTAAPHLDPKSFAFIPASLDDNQILLEKDPAYRANLQAQDPTDAARLLSGNWNIRVEGVCFTLAQAALADAAPPLSSGRVVVGIDGGGRRHPAALVATRVAAVPGSGVHYESFREEYFYGEPSELDEIALAFCREVGAHEVVIADDRYPMLRGKLEARLGKGRVTQVTPKADKKHAYYREMVSAVDAGRWRIPVELAHLRRDMMRAQHYEGELQLPEYVYDYQDPRTGRWEKRRSHCDAFDAVLAACSRLGGQIGRAGDTTIEAGSVPAQSVTDDDGFAPVLDDWHTHGF